MEIMGEVNGNGGGEWYPKQLATALRSSSTTRRRAELQTLHQTLLENGMLASASSGCKSKR